MSKKKKFLGLFAILFVAIFAVGCVFATACGKKNKEEDETPHSHSYTSTITKDPTCTEEGETTYTCDCGDTYTETIPATGHSYTAAWTWEGDEETGYTGASVTLTCSAEDSTVTYESKDVTFTAPSGTIYGTYTASVTVDGKTYSDSKTVTAPSVTEPAEEVSYNIDFSDPETYSWIGTPDTEGTTSDGTTFQYLTVDKTNTYTTGILTYMPYTGSKDTTINKENAGALYTAYATSSSTGSYFVLDLTGYEGFYVTISARMSSNTSGDASIYVSDTLSASGANSAKSSTNDDYQTLTYYSGVLTASDTALYITWDANIRLFTLDIAVTEAAPQVGHTHVYGDEPKYEWTSDGNGGYTVVGTLTCTADDCDQSEGYTLTGTATVEAKDVTTVNATCTVAGSVTCSAEVSIGGKAYTATYKETLAALGHDYPDPDVEADKAYIAWGWTSRGNTTVSLQITCKRCNTVVVNENVEFTETTTGVLSATYTVEGGYTYTDTYEIPETETHVHNYQITAWNWATDYSSCTVTVTCSSTVGTCDKQTDTLTATVTSETTTAPTCTDKGVMTYTATVTVNNVQCTDTKTAEIEALGHDYDTTQPSWEWTFDTEGKASATLSFICKNDSTHVWSQEVDQIEAVGGVYTATITGPDGQSYSDTATAPVVTEKETELHIDFSDSETWSWIETEETSYTSSGNNPTTTNYSNAVKGISATDGGLLTVAGTTNNTSSTPMDIGDKSASAMTTGGATQNGGRYFMIDLTGFEGKYVSISVVVSGTGSSNQSEKTVILSTTQNTTAASEETLADVKTSTSDVHQTLEYGALITAENNVLYLTWSDSVRIYTIDIIVSDEAPAEDIDPVAGTEWKGNASFDVSALGLEVTLYTDVTVTVSEEGKFSMELGTITYAENDLIGLIAAGLLNDLLYEYGLDISDLDYERDGDTYTVEIYEPELTDDPDGKIYVTAVRGYDRGYEYLSVSFTMSVELGGYGTAALVIEDQRVWCGGEPPAVTDISFGENANLILIAEAQAGSYIPDLMITVSTEDGESYAQAEWTGSIKWTSDNAAVATVDNAGNVTLTGAVGVAVITVKSGACSASYVIIVGGDEEIAESDAVFGTWTEDVEFVITYTPTFGDPSDHTIKGTVTAVANAEGFSLEMYIATIDDSTSNDGDTTKYLWTNAGLYKAQETYYIIASVGDGFDIDELTIVDGKLTGTLTTTTSIHLGTLMYYTDELELELALEKVIPGAVASADELLAALGSGEGTITLTGDIALEETLQISSDVTINLNGHELSIENVGNGVNTLTVSTGTKVTITGGTISNTYTGVSSTDNSAAIYSEGTLVLDGVKITSSSVGVRAVSGTVDMTNTTIESGYWAVWESAGTVTVTLGEGTVITGEAKTILVGGDADYGYDEYQVGAVTTLIVDGATITSNGESAISTLGTATSSSAIVIIKSGTITGYADGTTACPAVYIPNGTLYVLGGTITGSTALEIRGGTAYIYGGEFISSYTGEPKAEYNSSGATSVGYALTVYPYKSTKRDSDANFNNDVAVYVSGGTFTGAVYAADVSEVGAYALVISGGYFKEDPSDYVDTGVYNVVTVDDGELAGYYKVLSFDGLWGGDAEFSIYCSYILFCIFAGSDTVYLYADAVITVANGTFSLTLGSITAAEGDSGGQLVANILNAVLSEYGIELTATYERNGNSYTVKIENDPDFGTFEVTATVGCDADGDYISVSFTTTYELDIGTTIDADLEVENQKVRRAED